MKPNEALNITGVYAAASTPAIYLNRFELGNLNKIMKVQVSGITEYDGFHMFDVIYFIAYYIYIILSSDFK